MWNSLVWNNIFMFWQYSVDFLGRQGSTIVVVNILDIDDSDPVFDNLEYTLHVQEEVSRLKQKVEMNLYVLIILHLFSILTD